VESLLHLIFSQVADARQNCLRDITEAIMEPFNVLKDIREEEISALHAFGKSLHTIHWLRENVKGISIQTHQHYVLVLLII
jgi:hypothetical protein